MYLAENLKYLREQKGLSRRDFSTVLGISSAAVGMWEQNSRTPDIEMIIRLAEYFGVTLDDLILRNMKSLIPLYVSNIKYLRRKYEMTQESMATLLGFQDKSSLYVVEIGEVGLSIEHLEKLAYFFGVTTKQLVTQDLSKGVLDEKNKLQDK